MGKTEKKIKSERINALRKQYDAFLEEDKKRRERNEFILDRLDKIRYCTATVPYRKSNVSNLRSQIQFSRNQDIQARSTNEILAYLNSFSGIDDTTIQEICKKFVLIPKVPSSVPKMNFIENRYKDSEPNDNVDWKRKYEILNQLKNIEKGLGLENSVPKNELQKNSGSLNTKIEMVNTETEFRQDLPEKDVSDVTFHKTVTNKNYHNELSLEENQSEPNLLMPETSNFSQDNEYNEINVTPSTPLDNTEPIIAGNSNMIQNLNTENNDSQIFNPCQDLHSEIDQKTLTPLLDNTDHSKTHSPQFQETVDDSNLNEGEYCSTTNLGSNEVQLEKTEILSNTVDGPNETVISPLLVDDPENRDTTSPETVQVNETDDSIHHRNKEHESHKHNEQFEQQADSDVSGIEAFNAEQNEMFYTEQTDENYVYDQAVEGAQYNQGYEQKPDYEQNEQYAYYEGDQQQAYPPEINEHEETMERYDQNYEEQYAAYEQGDYNQQQEYEQPVEQYQQPVEQYEQPVEQYQQPVEQYQQPVEQYQQPVEQYQQPVEQYQQPEEQVQAFQQEPQLVTEFEQQSYENHDDAIHELVEQKMNNEEGFLEKRNIENITTTKPAVEEKLADVSTT
uniref:Uncharacterized protein n=1 Tax=Bombyx mori TaxID=7091 RepID=A0A8R2AGQ0_BOMMO|nr:activating signal cointegrator 1 complex subunit 2 homolog isoform X2 [Bombyx mori]